MAQINMRVAEAFAACALSAGTITLVEAVRFQRTEAPRKVRKEGKVEPVEEGKCSQFPCGFLSRGHYEPCRLKGGKVGAKKFDVGELRAQVLDRQI